MSWAYLAEAPARSPVRMLGVEHGREIVRACSGRCSAGGEAALGLTFRQLGHPESGPRRSCSRNAAATLASRLEGARGLAGPPCPLSGCGIMPAMSDALGPRALGAHCLPSAARRWKAALLLLIVLVGPVDLWALGNWRASVDPTIHGSLLVDLDLPSGGWQTLRRIDPQSPLHAVGASAGNAVRLRPGDSSCATCAPTSQSMWSCARITSARWRCSRSRSCVSGRTRGRGLRVGMARPAARLADRCAARAAPGGERGPARARRVPRARERLGLVPLAARRLAPRPGHHVALARARRDRIPPISTSA